jgi:integrase
VLSAIFNYATREDTFELPRNLVPGTDKRREPPASAVDFFEPEEVEALASAAAAGRHRRAAVGLAADEVAARSADDAQDAEMFRVLAYAWMRLGEVLAPQWGDVDLDGRRVIVQRAVSGQEEGPTKGWQVRYVQDLRSQSQIADGGGWIPSPWVSPWIGEWLAPDESPSDCPSGSSTDANPLLACLSSCRSSCQAFI